MAVEKRINVARSIEFWSEIRDAVEGAGVSTHEFGTYSCAEVGQVVSSGTLSRAWAGTTEVSAVILWAIMRTVVGQGWYKLPPDYPYGPTDYAIDRVMGRINRDGSVVAK